MRRREETEHLAEMMDGKGILVATDISQDRVKMVRETVGRMGFPFVTVLHADAARGPEPLAGGGDLLSTVSWLMRRAQVWA